MTGFLLAGVASVCSIADSLLGGLPNLATLRLAQCRLAACPALTPGTANKSLRVLDVSANDITQVCKPICNVVSNMLWWIFAGTRSLRVASLSQGLNVLHCQTAQVSLLLSLEGIHLVTHAATAAHCLLVGQAFAMGICLKNLCLSSPCRCRRLSLLSRLWRSSM